MSSGRQLYVDMICAARCIAQGARPVKVEADQKGRPKGEHLVCPHCGAPLVERS